jgi:hypothetical protein
MRRDAIVVSASYEKRDRHWIELAREKAVEVFGRPVAPFNDPIATVTEITPPMGTRALNDERSFLVAPDGSNEGWEHSDAGDAAREEFLTWLRDQAYEDGSSPLKWVAVSYGEDDAREARVVAESNQLRRAAREL